MECPSKLYYTGKKDQYYDSKLDDEFLKSLAEGGFQVGELAKRYFPGGYDIEDLEYETAINKTNDYLLRENVILYEAAFRFENLFIRADIIIKSGDHIQLIEVKAKSFDPAKDSFMGKKGGILSNWLPYLQDAAFQRYVIQNAYPGLKVQANLMLTDKSQVASVDGLNQLFLLYKEGNRQRCKYTGAENIESLGNRLLKIVPIDTEVEFIFSKTSPDFQQLIHQFEGSYATDEFIEPVFGKQCGKCEFKVTGEISELKSGFHECWQSGGHSLDDLKQPLVLDLWDFRKKDQAIGSGKVFLKDLSLEDIEPAKKTAWENPWLSRVARQELQINKVKNKDHSQYLDKEALGNEMATWQFPLHFIDFETTAVAIPFNSGRRPYEQVAFQFSHHQVHKDGTIEHKGEWINTVMGQFPNYDFVRALKKELETDNGTIFRYANHENTILNKIYDQLKSSNEIDKVELCAWIQTITHSTDSSTEEWVGHRDMVDLLEMVKHYYYDPLMGGSNSIKKVLPAILATSDFLKAKYSKPIYGTEIKSLNFKDHIWVNLDDSGGVFNPYSLLPSVHPGISNDMLDDFMLDEDADIMDGGAAMIAYARMQFTEMGDTERERIKQALLRYCELDTMAMVMIYEAWKNWCK
ncbi:MAG: hypothetical protein JWM28_2032 [Chitinophagaceae bacterium]|nr:hypothetical protein [Chitinophagaceae bacterium]